ncbi:MAG: hypothetical protein KDA41_07430, partial [Planctomycetales bacterium]|nr:hypothetical protein [Planctomycetales bacterium]
ASTRIAALAPTNEKAIETAYLATLTRRPTPAEAAHFAKRLGDAKGPYRNNLMEDIVWTLLNSTEFSWNH